MATPKKAILLSDNASDSHCLTSPVMLVLPSNTAAFIRLAAFPAHEHCDYRITAAFRFGKFDFLVETCEGQRQESLTPRKTAS
ncbi:unnamed protein product [Heligmosomoides polygyrus]|uniref:Uncharacterized protein n=1 Tax=Heligmosomoides polygyrus TaxID=6339 RepID=A0A183G496_HELPZ|nr:unnamed protein product [Heligmosomoides polygyrus]